MVGGGRGGGGGEGLMAHVGYIINFLSATYPQHRCAHQEQQLVLHCGRCACWLSFSTGQSGHRNWK